MTLKITFALKLPSSVYYGSEMVNGIVIIDCKSEEHHDGIMLILKGTLNIQTSTKSAGLLESLVHNPKPIILSTYAKEIAKPGKLQAGRTQFPFEFPLKPKPNRILYETFHGIYIYIQYTLKCDVKRSLLAKDISKTQEIFVHLKSSEEVSLKPINFSIHPGSLQNVRERARVPRFHVKGHLDSTVIPLNIPITGELIVSECERGIGCIELQLVRVETCGSYDMKTREVSEIQNIQLCSGDIARNLVIPIYMKLPRLFTCATTYADNFQIEFELNIIIIFDNDHLVMETFPIKLTRS